MQHKMELFSSYNVNVIIVSGEAILMHRKEKEGRNEGGREGGREAGKEVNLTELSKELI